jgi:hypothetical protein
MLAVRVRRPRLAPGSWWRAALCRAHRPTAAVPGGSLGLLPAPQLCLHLRPRPVLIRECCVPTARWIVVDDGRHRQPRRGAVDLADE